MQRKMRRQDVSRLYVAITAVLKREDPRDYDLNYALVRSKGKLRVIAEEIADMQQLAQRTQSGLALKFSKKNANGEPIVRDGALVGTAFGENPEYDAASQELQEKLKTYMREEVEVELHGVKRAAYENKKVAGTDLEVYCELTIDE